MTEIGSRSRSQSLRSSEGTTENQERISQDSQQQRRLSVDSVKNSTSRRISLSRRIGDIKISSIQRNSFTFFGKVVKLSTA